jgi:hypothetical protein
MSEKTAIPAQPLATADDVKRIIGELDEVKLLDILTLRPTILDLEEASLSLSGDTDILGASTPLKAVAGEIGAGGRENNLCASKRPNRPHFSIRD